MWFVIITAGAVALLLVCARRRYGNIVKGHGRSQAFGQGWLRHRTIRIGDYWRRK